MVYSAQCTTIYIPVVIITISRRGEGGGAGSPGFATVNIVTFTPYLSKLYFEFLLNST